MFVYMDVCTSCVDLDSTDNIAVYELFHIGSKLIRVCDGMPYICIYDTVHAVENNGRRLNYV